VGCKRAILVGHNALSITAFWNAAIERARHLAQPISPFLLALIQQVLRVLVFGQTVLAKACGSRFQYLLAILKLIQRNTNTEKTAELFCENSEQMETPWGWPDRK